ncbi:hypothetical protein [Aliiroseovarius sp. S253]|uniref:hypothetical protein n=1 Tax=Aliiroseovarius sp. S253 TaxID=3415133 RepID=UPI003C79E697
MRSWVQHLAAIFLLALPAQARDISVRSGEHAGFTRLVFYTKATDTIEVSNTDEGYLLSLSPNVTSFNLSRAFDLINRSRVHALIPKEAGKIAIQQGCDCHLTDFRLPTGELVIDIVDGPDPKAGTSVETISSSLPRAINVEQQRASLPLLSATANQSELADNQDKPSDDSIQEMLNSTVEAPKLNKQELLRQLSRAASQGLVDANITPSGHSQIALPAATEEPTPIRPSPSHTPDQHVRMQTAIELAQASQSSASVTTDANHACLPDEQFDIARWGAYMPEFNAPLFESSNYLGEFDRPDKALLVSHIRQKIYMTFGLEALQLMGNYVDNLGDGSVLRMMAEVVEYGEAKSHAHWDSQLICNTRGALWASLAQPTLQGRINTNAVLRSFSELPLHLRAHLAPGLARKLLDAGRVEAAVQIRNMATRSGRIPSGEEAILQAEIDLTKGETDKAEQELADTIQTVLTQTQPAISTLIESKLQNGKGISDNELSLLASVAFEHKGSTEGDRMQRLQIRALFHMGRFTPAFDLLDRSTPVVNHDELLNDAGSYLVSLGSDAEFLTYSLTRRDWGTISANVKLEMAERLSELGFHEHARRHVLSGNAPPSRTAREFLAKVAVVQNKPKVALGYLAGLDSDNANFLRKAAVNQSGNPDSQSASAMQATSYASDVRSNLDTPEHSLPATVQKLLASETPTSTVSIQSDLKTYQSILDHSSETRTALSDLLGIIPTIDGTR